MKAKIYITLIVAVTGCLTAFSQPRAEYPVKWHDFGVIHESDGLARCRFPLVNTGNKTIKVTSARANCGCTTPEYSRKGLAPGDTMWINVAYDPTGRPGRFEKRIYIDTNSEPSRETLTIRGTVIAEGATLDSKFPYHLDPVRIKDKVAMMGDVTPLQSKGTYIEAYNAGNDTIRPRAVVRDANILNIIIQPAVVPPGEQFIFSGVVGAGKQGQWGPQSTLFTVYSDAKSKEGMELEITYNVKEDFSSLTPEQIEKAPVIVVDNRVVDLGIIDATQSKPIKAHVKVSNRGKDALRIRRVWSIEPNVKFVVKNNTIKGGKSAEIEIELSPEAWTDAKMVNLPFEIISNDPSSSILNLRLAGEVR